MQRNNLVASFRSLELGSHPVIAHASLSAFGHIPGGAETIVSALREVFDSFIMPVFTYKTMIIPLTGPPDNGIRYGSGTNSNRMAEFFSPDMPADRTMGIIPETLRRSPGVRRSSHPILSFCGVNAENALEAQSLAQPFAPIQALAEKTGWVVLLGVNHTTNTSIHFAEQMAGRKQFIRWALTPRGVRECGRWPGCSAGFQDILPYLEGKTRQVKAGDALVQAVALGTLVEVVVALLERDPMALLCQREDCERCAAVRADVTYIPG